VKKFKPKLIFLIVVPLALYLLWADYFKIPELRPVFPVNFFLPERFWEGVEYAEGQNQKNASRIFAAVLPHHLLAGRLISGVFKELNSQSVKNIILIGPNHYEAGAFNLQSSSADWQSPLGLVSGYRAFSYLPEAQAETMVNEHSVAGLMPYVGHYFPQAKVFSVIIKHNTGDAELEALANEIVKKWDKQTALLASVDFSHYLPRQIAEGRDEFTRQVLMSMDEKELYGLNNDYADSPGSLALLLKVCKKLGAKVFSIKDHSNSADILNNPAIQSTTSYFTGYCEERSL